jgi:hypothetical protein
MYTTNIHFAAKVTFADRPPMLKEGFAVTGICRKTGKKRKNY